MKKEASLHKNSALQQPRHRRNININGKRTCISLEESLWHFLEEAAEKENMTISALCSKVAERTSNSSLTSNIRVFLLAYYKVLSLQKQDDFSDGKITAPPQHKTNSAFASAFESIN